MKICSECKVEKEDNCFSKQRKLLRGKCKNCIKIINAQYYVNNKDKISKKTKTYWANNKKS